MKYILSSLILFSTFLVGAQLTLADDKQSIVFRAERKLDFVPERALFILHDLLSGDYLIKNGYLIEKTTAETSGEVVALLKQEYETQGSIHFSFKVLFLDKNGNFDISGLRTVSKSEHAEFLLSAEALEQEYVSGQEALKALQVQVREKEKALDRLRKDLSIIGYFNKATELENEIVQLKRQIESAEEQEELFRDFLKLVKRQKTPAQFPLRKQELSRVAAEVRSVLQEQKEKKVDYSSSQFLSDLNLVEQTRGEDLDKLREELIRLRKLRQEQESVTPPVLQGGGSQGISGFRSFERAPAEGAPQAPPVRDSQNDT